VDQNSDGFVRQRRNLMIVSLVLLFSEITELKVEKISAFGTELLVGQPQAVTATLWVASIYWLLRFYQYSDLSSLRAFVRDRVFKTCGPVALRRLDHDDKGLSEPVEGVNAIPTFEYSIVKFGNESNYLDLILRLTKTSLDGRSIATQAAEERSVRLHWTDTYWLRIKAWFHMGLNTSLFTDLVLPYIVFAAPVIYTIYKITR
jgi:hypothetical protein